jgi:hypothetical protein
VRLWSQYRSEERGGERARRAGRNNRQCVA